MSDFVTFTTNKLGNHATNQPIFVLMVQKNYKEIFYNFLKLF